MPDAKMFFNGLNGATGRPLLPAQSFDDLAAWIMDEHDHEDPKIREGCSLILANRQMDRLGVVPGYDQTNLDEVHWGIIHGPDIPEKDIRSVLGDLIDKRKAHNNIFTYVPGESHDDFWKRRNQNYGLIDPDRVPYYLLLIGSPEQIPFSFQYGLDTQNAVGRLYFEDLEDYRRYAQNVLAYEQAETLQREARVAFFAPHHDHDQATENTATYLVRPLVNTFANDAALGFTVEHYHKDGQVPTKQNLLDLLTRTNQQPSLLFTATHGLMLPIDDYERQRKEQGAFVCQDWPGDKPGQEKPISNHMYLAGTDLKGDMRFDGLIAFAFACYSGGTPRLSDFAHFDEQRLPELTQKPFVAYLPQRLLAQGALAFIGHVERVWDYSFTIEEQPGFGYPNTDTFKHTLRAVLKGVPVGHAMEMFNQRYLSLNQVVFEGSKSLFRRYFKEEDDTVDLGDLARQWAALHDARSYVLYGDPYVSLRIKHLSALRDT